MRFAPGAWRYVWAAILVAVLSVLLSPVLSVVAAAAGVVVLWFYRDPERTPPPAGVLAPADGRVTVVREEDKRLRVGVFMTIADVHVNRAPVGGTVAAIDRTDGAHRPAFSKDSEHNERVRVDFGDHAVVLIAGAVARRITTYVEPGDEVTRGDRIGHIAFGSRTDVLLPPSIGPDDLLVEPGDRVKAGETVIADGP